MPKLRRGRVEDVGNTDLVKCGLTFSGEDAKLIRHFMQEAGYTNVNTAIRVLVLGAVVDYPRWGVITAERRAEYHEFQWRMREEFLRKLEELRRDITDELVLMKGAYSHADQT